MTSARRGAAEIDPRTIVITVDTEWAHADVLSELLDLLDVYGVRATLFATDAAASCRGHEVGVHPNFRRAGTIVRRVLADPSCPAALSDESALYDGVLAEYRKLFPRARCVRTHSLMYDSLMLPAFRRHGFTCDSTYFCPFRCVAPFFKEHDLLEVPLYYMDHGDITAGWTRFRVEDLQLDQPGLKVFDFHPNMVYINAISDAHYQASKAHYHEPEKLVAYRREGAGVRTLLTDLLEHVRRHRLPLLTLGEVEAMYRRAAV